MVLVANEIGGRESVEQQLDLSSRDPLTGLVNREQNAVRAEAHPAKREQTRRKELRHRRYPTDAFADHPATRNTSISDVSPRRARAKPSRSSGVMPSSKLTDGPHWAARGARRRRAA